MNECTQRLYELIKTKGISANALANELDITSASVYKWFRKDNSTTPSQNNLLKALQVLNVTPAEFFNDFEFPQLTEQQQELLKHWSFLDPEEKDILLELMKKIGKKRR